MCLICRCQRGRPIGKILHDIKKSIGIKSDLNKMGEVNGISMYCQQFGGGGDRG